MAVVDLSPAGEREWLFEVGLRVRVARMRRRISQEEMASEAGISRVTLGSIERGEHCATGLTYRRLAVALPLPLDVLLGEVPE